MGETGRDLGEDLYRQKRAVSAKVPWQAWDQTVPGIARKPMWLEQNEGGREWVKRSSEREWGGG